MSETDQRVTVLINSAVKQLDILLTELKALTDEEKIRLREEDVNVALNSALQLVASRLSTSNIDVTQDLQAGAMLVLIPAGQLTQVFFNLLLNAIEAMPQGGILKLKTKLKSCQETIRTVNSVKKVPKSFVATLDFLTNSATEIIEITISDTGCGISNKYLYKIFKSGFTTKASSGLGLAAVKRIINMCEGKIEVHSQLGVGTDFVIQLPCYRHLINFDAQNR
jgi:signal transduction histidine kinase